MSAVSLRDVVARAPRVARRRRHLLLALVEWAIILGLPAVVALAAIAGAFRGMAP